jgi:hypothetical protein
VTPEQPISVAAPSAQKNDAQILAIYWPVWITLDAEARIKRATYVL